MSRSSRVIPPFLDDRVRRIARWFRRPDFEEADLVHTLLKPFSPGVMVDVGAHHGSSLRPFAEDGWVVYALEPDPRNREVLLRRTSRWANVVVDARAVSDEDGQLVPLFTSGVSSGISTLAPFHPSHAPTTSVETVRLDTFLAQVDQVTFLKTDTEGWDLPVLQTFPWDRLQPRAVMCEFEDRKTVPLGYDYRDLADYLGGLGLAVFASEWYPVIEYGKRHRWRSIRKYPVELTDPRSWGNLVAISPAIEASFERLLPARARSSPL